MSLPWPQLFWWSENLQEYNSYTKMWNLEGLTNSMWNLTAMETGLWQAVALWWPLLVAMEPVIIVTFASTTKRCLPLTVTTTERFHWSLNWNMRVCMCPDCAGGGRGESGMVFTVGVGPHNVPHCCPLLKKTPLPEWHLDMWYLWRWAPYIQDTPAVCKEINTNMKSRNSLLRKCFLRPVIFIQ